VTPSQLFVAGLAAAVEVQRDPEGIPHVRAGSARDAFFGQGFVHAQEADRLSRRFRLGGSVRVDWEHSLPETRAMLLAFASGVNAFIAQGLSW